MKRGGADSIGVGALISGRGGDVPVRCARVLLCFSSLLHSAKFSAWKWDSSGMLVGDNAFSC